MINLSLSTKKRLLAKLAFLNLLLALTVITKTDSYLSDTETTAANSPWQAQTQYTVSSIAKGTYYWQVTASNQFGYKKVSTSRELKVDRATPTEDLDS